MKKWEHANYLIEAKKVIDSLWYIILYKEQIDNLDLRGRVKDLRQKFYLYCGYVLENSGLNKKEICANNDSIKEIFYERDKNEAHKDENYHGKRVELNETMINSMKKQIGAVRDVCANSLPENITLDFVPYDKELFRFVNSITPEREEEIKKSLYLQSEQAGNEANIKKYICLQDVEDIRYMSAEEKERLAVMMENGICIEEGFQNRQDACIKINCIYNLDMWVTPNREQYKTIKKLQEVGCIDIYGRLKIGFENDCEMMGKMIEILDEVLDRNDKGYLL